MSDLRTARAPVGQPGHVGVDFPHLDNTCQLLSKGRSMGDRRYSTAKVDLGLLTPEFPLLMNKQSQRCFSLLALGSAARSRSSYRLSLSWRGG